MQYSWKRSASDPNLTLTNTDKNPHIVDKNKRSQFQRSQLTSDFRQGDRLKANKVHSSLIQEKITATQREIASLKRIISERSKSLSPVKPSKTSRVDSSKQPVKISNIESSKTLLVESSEKLPGEPSKTSPMESSKTSLRKSSETSLGKSSKTSPIESSKTSLREFLKSSPVDSSRTYSVIISEKLSGESPKTALMKSSKTSSIKSSKISDKIMKTSKLFMEKPSKASPVNSSAPFNVGNRNQSKVSVSHKTKPSSTIMSSSLQKNCLCSHFEASKESEKKICCKSSNVNALAHFSPKHDSGKSSKIHADKASDSKPKEKVLFPVNKTGSSIISYKTPSRYVKKTKYSIVKMRPQPAISSIGSTGEVTVNTSSLKKKKMEKSEAPAKFISINRYSLKRVRRSLSDESKGTNNLSRCQSATQYVAKTVRSKYKMRKVNMASIQNLDRCGRKSLFTSLPYGTGKSEWSEVQPFVKSFRQWQFNRGYSRKQFLNGRKGKELSFLPT